MAAADEPYDEPELEPSEHLKPQDFESVRVLLRNFDKISRTALGNRRKYVNKHGQECEVMSPDLKTALAAQAQIAKILALYDPVATKPTDAETRSVTEEYLVKLMEDMGFEVKKKEPTGKKEPDGK